MSKKSSNFIIVDTLIFLMYLIGLGYPKRWKDLSEFKLNIEEMKDAWILAAELTFLEEKKTFNENEEKEQVKSK